MVDASEGRPRAIGSTLAPSVHHPLRDKGVSNECTAGCFVGASGRCLALSHVGNAATGHGVVNNRAFPYHSKLCFNVMRMNPAGIDPEDLITLGKYGIRPGPVLPEVRSCKH